CCGLLYSCPSGEKPVTVMRLSPASRVFVHGSGNPTARLTVLPSSGNTLEETRLNPTRVSLSRFADRMCVALATKFCPRLATSLPYPGNKENPGPLNG